MSRAGPLLAPAPFSDEAELRRGASQPARSCWEAVPLLAGTSRRASRGRGAPLRRRRGSCVALVTFFGGHLAHDKSAVGDVVFHLLLARGLLRVAALAL